MQIIKKINTSAALALDKTGHEIVVMGKGIGFPPVPYELNDLSKIERTFYDVDPKYLSMIAELSQPIVMACADIADQAGIELECPLNPNLPFTLADHVQFAVERLKKGVNLTTPIAYDIRHLYPKETAMADTALQMLREQAGLDLPDNEAINIAMHFINAEAESGDMHSLMLSMQRIYGNCFFSMPYMEFAYRASSSVVLTFLCRAFNQLVIKPPVPQAKSAIFSPICGLIICAIKSVTARGV